MSRPVHLGKGYAVKAGKVVAKSVAAKDAAAKARQRPGGSKRVRVKRRGG